MSDDPHAGQPGDTQAARNDGTVTLTLAELSAAIREQVAPLVNGAVKTHLKRWQDQQAETRDDSDADDEPAPRRKAKGEDSEVAKLRRQLEAMAKERDEEKARTQEVKRDTALRAALEKRGFRSPDIAMAAVKAGLKVEDGSYVHEGQDGLPVPLDSYLDGFAKEQSWMLNPSGRPGGGAVGSSQGGGIGRPMPAIPDGLSATALMDWAEKNGMGPPKQQPIRSED